MKNNIDMVKIDGGRCGVVNFNNMIPVTSNNYELFDLNAIPKDTNELKRQNLLKTQLLWLNKNIKRVKEKAVKLYEKYKNGKLDEKIKPNFYNCIVTYNNSYYNSSFNFFNLNLLSNVHITASPNLRIISSNCTISSSIFDDVGNSIDKGEVIFKIFNEEYIFNPSNNISINFKLPDIAGVYNYSIEFTY